MVGADLHSIFAFVTVSVSLMQCSGCWGVALGNSRRDTKQCVRLDEFFFVLSDVSFFLNAIYQLVINGLNRTRKIGLR